MPELTKLLNFICCSKTGTKEIQNIHYITYCYTTDILNGEKQKETAVVA